MMTQKERTTQQGPRVEKDDEDAKLKQRQWAWRNTLDNNNEATSISGSDHERLPPEEEVDCTRSDHPRVYKRQRRSERKRKGHKSKRDRDKKQDKGNGCHEECDLNSPQGQGMPISMTKKSFGAKNTKTTTTLKTL